jgi:hypothetical protein
MNKKKYIFGQELLWYHKFLTFLLPLGGLKIEIIIPLSIENDTVYVCWRTKMKKQYLLINRIYCLIIVSFI